MGGNEGRGGSWWRDRCAGFLIAGQAWGSFDGSSKSLGKLYAAVEGYDDIPPCNRNEAGVNIQI